VSSPTVYYSLTGILIVILICFVIPFVCYVVSKAITRGKLHAVRDNLRKMEKDHGKKNE
jgi:hypothetical protein